MTATTEALFRYPVKSMGGERLGALRVSKRGVPGDRAWALRDEARGGIRCGKRFPELMACSARYSGDPPEQGCRPAWVTLPDGGELSIAAGDAAPTLSELVQSPVSVWPILNPTVLARFHAGNPTAADTAALEGAFDDDAEAVTGSRDLDTFPTFLNELRDLSRGYYDAYPILIMTTESLLHLGNVAPARNLALSRFRPNVLLRTETGEAFPEREWVGRTLRVGEAEFDIAVDCLRCVMTTHGHGIVPHDPAVIADLEAHADNKLGVYATVRTPGRLRIGDAATLV
ncbi:MAG: hypothetical protein CMD83_09610 [Gammaproteobacteria bacterium]|nr:hypothetical protein [Gammaproteobacteria bacterium]